HPRQAPHRVDQAARPLRGPDRGHLAPAGRLLDAERQPSAPRPRQAEGGLHPGDPRRRAPDGLRGPPAQRREGAQPQGEVARGHPDVPRAGEGGVGHQRGSVDVPVRVRALHHAGSALRGEQAVRRRSVRADPPSRRQVPEADAPQGPRDAPRARRAGSRDRSGAGDGRRQDQEARDQSSVREELPARADHAAHPRAQDPAVLRADLQEAAREPRGVRRGEGPLRRHPALLDHGRARGRLTVPGPLAGRVAVITGGTGALGQAVTLRFVADGAIVALPYAVQAERDRLYERVAAADRDRLVMGPVDVGDLAAMTAFATSTVAARGKIDVLVAGVGGFAGGSLLETDAETWKRMLDLNLTTAFSAAKAVLPPMVGARYGRIVIVASRAVVPPAGGFIAYTVAKAGVIAFTQALAQETREHGVTVNAVLPSTMDTPANRAAMPDAVPAGVCPAHLC